MSLKQIRVDAEVIEKGGVDTGGPPAFSQANRMAFANQQDRLLTA